jgi:hypothetical protein
MERIFALFDTRDEALNIQPFGTGKINHTFLVKGHLASYILQEINTKVFPNPGLIMENIDLITQHIEKKEPGRRNLRIIPTLKGDLGYAHGESYWRLYNYLENTKALEVIDSPKDAYAAALGFGHFLYVLSDLDPMNIQPALPYFHKVGFRVSQLEEAVRLNRVGRLEKVSPELEQIKGYQPLVMEIFHRIEKGEVPLRITHNDTKISNVLLDRLTLEPVAVVDLDTAMPGSVLFDLGDMIRTFVSPADENEPDLSKVYIRPEILEALVEGYHHGTRGILTVTEREMVIDAGMMLVFTQAIRFLADYLNGDVYYKTEEEEQNLVRTKNQLKLLSLLFEEEERWKSIVKSTFLKK